MSRTVSMQFGKPNGVLQNINTGNSVVYNGTIDDGSTVVLTLEQGGLYELFTAEFNASTGAYRGHRQINIKVPESTLYGTIACAYGNAYASSNSGVTITYNADSTISISRSSATYTVIYVLIAVGIKIGNVSSSVTAAETARDQAQSYASQAASSAAEALTASSHYPKIENGYWHVWDVVNQTWVSTGVKAQGEQGQPGETGAQGVSVTSVTKASGTGSPGTTDTYNVNLSDSTVAGQFTVYNGADGQGSSVSFQVTLSSSSWSSNEQTVNDARFVSSGYAYIVAPASGSFSDYSAAQIYADEVSTNGQMTFHCGSVPSSSLTVNIVKVAVS